MLHAAWMAAPEASKQLRLLQRQQRMAVRLQQTADQQVPEAWNSCPGGSAHEPCMYASLNSLACWAGSC